MEGVGGFVSSGTSVGYQGLSWRLRVPAEASEETMPPQIALACAAC